MPAQQHRFVIQQLLGDACCQLERGVEVECEFSSIQA